MKVLFLIVGHRNCAPHCPHMLPSTRVPKVAVARTRLAHVQKRSAISQLVRDI